LEKPKKFFILEIFIPFPLHRVRRKKSSIKITNDKIFHVTNARKTRINWDQDYFSLEKILLQSENVSELCVFLSHSLRNKKAWELTLKNFYFILFALSLSRYHHREMWKCCEFTLHFSSSSSNLHRLSRFLIFALSYVELHADDIWWY
jgi:hypothetical protein